MQRLTSFRHVSFASLAFFGLSTIWLIIAIRFSQTGWDFTQFYVAAHLPIHSLYDRAQFIQVGQSLLAPLGIQYFPPYVRPAVFALAFKPLSWFSYWTAYWFWAAAGFLSFFASALLLIRRFALPPAILPAFALFFPAMFGIVTGQDTSVYLLVVVAAVLLILDGREVAGGLLLALCVYKFNLVLFVPLVFLFKARWKPLFTFAAGAVAAAVSSALLAPPASYLALLRIIPRETIGFVPAGLHGVAIRLGHERWYFPLAALLAVFCIYLIFKLPPLESLSVAILAPLLFGYHVTWYDCALLPIPLAVAWRGASKRVRAGLLAMLLVPFAWIFGGQFFQVAAELFLLARFTYLARMQSISELAHEN